jgi:type IV pilus assembly protein PilM
MAERVIGLDVGTEAVRVAEVALGREPTLLRFGQVGLPPGAVREGEVFDPEAVAEAIEKLWKAVGLRQKTVRVGIASARVILRTVDMPVLSDADTRSTLALQLEDYVPLAPESTVFGFQAVDEERSAKRAKAWSRAAARNGEAEHLPDEDAEDEAESDERSDGKPPEGQRRLLLAAAHVDAVQPLLEAARRAGLKVKAVDVVPAALARSLTGPQDGEPPAVEAIASLGAGTTVVVIARAGTPLFARTVTNVSGSYVTERIAHELSISTEDAEKVKRGMDIGLPREVVESVELVTRRAVSEVVDEVADSLGYYASQPGMPPVQRVILTGGAAQVHGAATLVGDRLGLPVSVGDLPRHIHGVPLGFDDIDLPYLAPYLATAVGVALGGAGGAATIHLAPARTKGASSRRIPIMAAAGATVVTALLAGTYIHRSGTIGDEKAALDTAQRALAQRQTTKTAVKVDTSSSAGATLVRAARTGDVDWPALSAQLRALSSPVGVTLTSMQGSAKSGLDALAAKGGSGTSGSSAAGGSTTTAPAAPTTTAATAGTGTTGAGATAAAAQRIGKLNIEGIATDLKTVAAWVDAINADPRFADAWVSAVNDRAGQSGLHFSATFEITSRNVVSRPTLDSAAR